MTAPERITTTEERVTVRVSDAPSGAVRLEVMEDSGTTPPLLTIEAANVTFVDAREQPEVFWRNIARRMDDAYNAGEPLWSRLTREEVEALTNDGVDTIPESASELGKGGRMAHDARVQTTW